MCNLFVSSCSRMNCLMRKVPAVNGRSAAPAAVFKLICLSQTMPRYLKESVSQSSLSANPFLWRSLVFNMPCLVRLSLIFFLNGKTNSAISFRTLCTIFWPAKTSNKPISLTAWLAVNPTL